MPYRLATSYTLKPHASFDSNDGEKKKCREHAMSHHDATTVPTRKKQVTLASDADESRIEWSRERGMQDMPKLPLEMLMNCRKIFWKLNLLLPIISMRYD